MSFRSSRKTLLVPGLFAIVALAAWFFYALQPLAPLAEKQQFQIASGASFRSIGSELQGAGIIRSAVAFDGYALLTGRARHLKPGRYELSPSDSAAAVSAILAAGPETEATVTIPEGLTAIDIDGILSAAGVTAPGKFLALAQAGSLEGRLFPDTYRFYFGSEPQVVLDKLLANFNKQAAPLLAADLASASRDLILASILEKEVPTLEDREIVAGILIKRVATGIPLQVDASLCYIKQKMASGSPCEPLTTLDKKIESPYNTYLHSGWPPGSISNPGVLAITAALHPVESPYWYYLSDPKNGKTIFAKTLDEQVANQLKYLSKD